MSLPREPSMSGTGGRGIRREGALAIGGLVVLTLAAFLYHYLQARGRVTPWIFPDELQYVDAMRAVADTGVPEVRGELSLVGALHAFLLAPAWMLGDVANSWEMTKAINVAAFVSSSVPVYMLVRVFRGRQLSIVAAAAAVALPGAFYGSTSLAEPLAYPVLLWAALATFSLIAWGFHRRWLVVLIVACAVGVGLRGQMAAIPIATAMAVLLAFPIASRGPRRNSFILVAACFGAGALLTVAARFDSIADYATAITSHPRSILGAVVIGVGATVCAIWVVPAVAYGAAFSWLRRPAGSKERAFAATLLAFAVVFASYSGIKSGVLGGVWTSIPEERNLIYLEPLAIAGLAVVPGRVGWLAGAVSGVTVLLLVAAAPLEQVATSSILSETPGLSWVWHAGRAGGGGVAGWLLPLFLGLAVVAAFAVWRGRPCVLLVAVAGALVWSGSLAYRGDHSFSREIAARWLGENKEWVDEQVGDGSAMLALSNDIADLNGLWSLAFWNPSLRAVTDVDGSQRWGSHASSYGIRPDGSLGISDARWVLASSSLGVVGRVAAAHPQSGYLLTETAAAPRVFGRVSGRFADQWTGETLVLSQYPPAPAGILSLPLSTESAFIAGPRAVSTILDARPRRWTIPPGARRTLELPVPAGRWDLYFTFSPVESPLERGAGTDPRPLSLRVGAVQFPAAPRGL